MRCHLATLILGRAATGIPPVGNACRPAIIQISLIIR